MADSTSSLEGSYMTHRPCQPGEHFEHNFMLRECNEKRDLWRCTCCGLQKLVYADSTVLYQEPRW